MVSLLHSQVLLRTKLRSVRLRHIFHAQAPHLHQKRINSQFAFVHLRAPLFKQQLREVSDDLLEFLELG